MDVSRRMKLHHTTHSFEYIIEENKALKMALNQRLFS